MPPMKSGKHDVRSLDAMAGRLEAAAGSLRSIVALMKDLGFDTLEIFYSDGTLAALEKIENFASSGHTQFAEARKARGDFGPVNGEKPKPKRGKKPTP